jgi:tetratricopeptide (TPR) repeat protein
MMKWYDSPYMLLAIFVLFVCLFVLTTAVPFLIFALFPGLSLIYAITQQPEIITRPRAVMAHNTATRYVFRNNLSEARRLYSLAIERHPRFALAYQNRGLLAMEQRQFAEAMADFETALKIDDSLEESYAARGKLYEIAGHTDRAMSDWTQAELMRSRLVYTLRGDYYMRSGQTMNAYRDFRQAALMNPKNANMQSNYGFVSALVGDLDEALAACELARKLDATFAPLYNSRGLVHYRKKDYQAALSDFLKANELRPDNAFALAGQAVSYQAIGLMKEAAFVWRHLTKLDLRYQNARALIEDYGMDGEFLNEAERIARLASEGATA